MTLQPDPQPESEFLPRDWEVRRNILFWLQSIVDSDSVDRYGRSMSFNSQNLEAASGSQGAHEQDRDCSGKPSERDPSLYPAWKEWAERYGFNYFVQVKRFAELDWDVFEEAVRRWETIPFLFLPSKTTTMTTQLNVYQYMEVVPTTVGIKGCISFVGTENPDDGYTWIYYGGNGKFYGTDHFGDNRRLGDSLLGSVKLACSGISREE